MLDVTRMERGLGERSGRRLSTWRTDGRHWIMDNSDIIDSVSSAQRIASFAAIDTISYAGPAIWPSYHLLELVIASYFTRAFRRTPPFIIPHYPTPLQCRIGVTRADELFRKWRCFKNQFINFATCEVNLLLLHYTLQQPSSLSVELSGRLIDVPHSTSNTAVRKCIPFGG